MKNYLKDSYQLLVNEIITLKYSTLAIMIEIYVFFPLMFAILFQLRPEDFNGIFEIMGITGIIMVVVIMCMAQMLSFYADYKFPKGRIIMLTGRFQRSQFILANYFSYLINYLLTLLLLIVPFLIHVHIPMMKILSCIAYFSFVYGIFVLVLNLVYYFCNKLITFLILFYSIMILFDLVAMDRDIPLILQNMNQEMLIIGGFSATILLVVLSFLISLRKFESKEF
jgi:hypothetical protein